MDPAVSARNEALRLRRDETVDRAWYLGFVIAFGLAGIIAFKRLADNFSDAPGKSIAIYVATILIAGLVGGLSGIWVGNRVSDRADRRDVARGPSAYEPATQDERLAIHTTLHPDPRE
jgi:hypothetical protein